MDAVPRRWPGSLDVIGENVQIANKQPQDEASRRFDEARQTVNSLLPAPEADDTSPDRPLFSTGWLSVKRNFLIASVFFVGVVPGIVIAWMLSTEMPFPPALMTYTIIVSAIAGFVWGLMMWRFFQFKQSQWDKRVVTAKRDDA